MSCCDNLSLTEAVVKFMEPFKDAKTAVILKNTQIVWYTG